MVAGVLALGCADPKSSTSVLSCEDDDLPAYDYGVCGTTPSAECIEATLLNMGQECEREGYPCDTRVFIAPDSAVCFAKAAGLEPGLRTWELDLVFHHGDKQRPHWNITNLQYEDDGSCLAYGQTFVIDPVTAAVMGTGWRRVC